MELTTQDVEHIARLARVGMTPGEIEILRGQLSDILGSFQVLAEVDTEGVETTAHPAGAAGALRPDESSASQARDAALSNVPNRHGDFVRVRAILQ